MGMPERTFGSKERARTSAGSEPGSASHASWPVAMATAALLIVSAPGSPVAALQDVPGGSVVTVSGRGTVEAEADRASIFLAVETEGSSAREAAGQNADLMTAVTGAVRSAGEGAEGFRVSTSGFALSPRYGDQVGREPRIVGYVARNTLEVTVDEVDRVGALIDAGLMAGANRVSGLDFQIRDPEPLRTEALREAIRLARAQAETMADALGMTLGPPLDVQGGADFPYPQPFARPEALEMRAQAPTPIESGPLTVSANVTIRFRLDPRP